MERKGGGDRGREQRHDDVHREQRARELRRPAEQIHRILQAGLEPKTDDDQRDARLQDEWH
jgi:hypothetical protein